MADGTSFLYGSHPENHAFLNSTEHDIQVIESTSPPIYVFWNVVHKIKNPESWPERQVYSSPSEKTTSAVFVTYQSVQDPLPALGLPGDTWLTDRYLYIKEKDISWIRWKPGVKFYYPYDTGRLLVWSRGVHFKYLAPGSAKTEKRRWNDPAHGPLHASIATAVLNTMPEASAALGKKYGQLTEADIISLLTAHCVSRRGIIGVDAHRYRNPLDGYESSDTFLCPNGMQVFLPYANNDPENARVHTCRWLLSGEDAITTPVGGPSPINKLPLIAVFESPAPRGAFDTWWALKYQLNTVASTARVSLLTNVVTDKPEYEWTERSLSSVMRREVNGGLVRWQSALRNDELSKMDKPPETITGTLGNLIGAARNTKDSVNCLDSPTIGGEQPSIIQQLSTSSRALSSTSSVTLEFSDAQPRKLVIAAPKPVAKPVEDSATQEPAGDPTTQEGEVTNTPPILECSTSTASQRPSSSRTEEPKEDSAGGASKRKRAPSQRIAQANKKKATEKNTVANKRKTAKAANNKKVIQNNETAKESEDQDQSEPLPPRAKCGIEAIFQDFLTYANSKGGMHSIEFDAIKSGSWIIIASTGAVSETHHDASGFVTWIKCDTGGKIWGYVVPKEHLEGHSETQSEEPAKEPPDHMARAMMTYFNVVNNNRDTSKLDKIAKPVHILLRPGTMVIQPPGALHLVYTVEPSIFTCGHCYMMDAMHLTEVCRACAAYDLQGGTNASHPGSVRLLSRVALDLAYDWKESVLRKPFISLARMLLWAHLYAPGDIDLQDPEFKHDKESLGEHAAAQAVVEAVLEHNDIFLADIQPEPLENFHWLSRIGEGEDWTDWRDPGTVRLAVPDMRKYFYEYEQMLAKREQRLAE